MTMTRKKQYREWPERQVYPVKMFFNKLVSIALPKPFSLQLKKVFQFIEQQWFSQETGTNIILSILVEWQTNDGVVEVVERCENCGLLLTFPFQDDLKLSDRILLGFVDEFYNGGSMKEQLHPEVASRIFSSSFKAFYVNKYSIDHHAHEIAF